MRRTATAFVAFVAIVVLLAGGVIAQQKRPQDIDLQAAIRTETVDGDLNGAIKQYGAIVSTYKADRAVTATALVHMAECYQKLGDAEARRIYERLVRQFSDQKEAVAIARARLGSGEPTTTQSKGERAVWTGPLVDLFGQVSPDGRYITFVDWANSGNVMLHDVVTNTDHRITPKTTWKETGAEGGYSTISRDGKQVAYAWHTWGAYDDKGKDHVGLYIAPLQEGGHQHARRLLEATDDVSYFDPYDWSPDGKWIALAIEKRKDGIVQIALASVADGSLHVLKTLDWRGPEKIFFSPDGKYLTYRLSISDTSDDSHVLVMAIDGSREITAVTHQSKNWPLGWSPDGSRLLFASDRTGSVGLWSLPFTDGKPQGSPELLKADIGSVSPLGVTRSGGMYVFKSVGDRDVHIAPFDVKEGKLLAPAASLAKGFVEEATDPDWSPDGKYLAYAACGGHCIALRSVESGEVRRLRALWYARLPHWSPDGRSLIVVGRDLKGRNGIFQVDAQTAQITPVVLGVNSSASPQWSLDGRKIFYAPRQQHVLLERELSSGTEREIFREPFLREEVSLSPDGKYFAATTEVDPSTKTSKLLLVPAAGGETRELLRLMVPEAFDGARTIAWTPDGRALLVAKQTVDPSTFLATVKTHAELWLVSVNDGPPRKLDIDVDAWGRGNQGYFEVGFSLSPDGRQIAFLMGKRGYEIWALENVLPARTEKKQPGKK